jgi:predicted transcriptional regulator of viral defense system
MRESQEIALVDWLARHHGVVTAAQAARLGIGPRTLYRLAAGGRLVRRHPGVYVQAATGAAASTAWLADAAAALAALGSDGALSHRSAAWMWDLLPRPPRPVEVLIPAVRNRSRLTGVCLHRSALPYPLRSRLGLRLTDPIRTVVDLAATHPALIDGVIDRAVTQRLLRAGDLEAAADRVQGVRYRGISDRRQRGAATLRSHLDQLGYLRPPAPSVLESLMARVFVRYQLPLPCAEFTAGSDGQYRLDFAYPELKLAIEVDGYIWHSDPRQVDADYARRRKLEAEGWVILSYTWRQITRDPEGVAAEIAERYARLVPRR